MSTIQNQLNKAIVSYLQLNDGKFLLGDKLMKISLAIPSYESPTTRKQAASMARLVVNGQAMELDSLQDSDAITFNIELIAINLNTSFSHEVLKSHNQTMFEVSDKFTASYDGQNIKLERDSFLGETIPSDTIASLIRLFVKQGKTQKSAQQWRKRQGSYEKLVSGEWQAIVSTPKTEKSAIESAIETNQPLLDLGKIASAVMNVQAPMTVISPDMHQTKPRAKRTSKK